MFVPNDGHLEDFLAIWSKILSPKKLKRLLQSSGYAFYKLIFCNIREEDFRILYSEKYSAPNSPVNCLVSALFLLHRYNWSFETLMDEIDFNVEIRVALGLKDLESVPFSQRTLFNFKNRLVTHCQTTGENLLEKVFDHLTELQLKELKIKTNIQRADTVLLNSNIRSYSRLALLVEVLRRVYRILSKEHQQSYSAWFDTYQKGGEKFIYTLKSGQYQEQLEAIARVYYGVHSILSPVYSRHSTMQVFERVYREHFKELESDSEEAIQVLVRSKDELSSDSLQSPDDVDATFRNKRGESYQGFAAFGAETCHPDNELNLVTKLALDTNNTDDSEILEGKLDEMIETTADLDEFHQDGGFGSEGVDAKADEHGIVLIQTAVKGPTASVPMIIEGSEKQGYTVNCPNPDHGPVPARKAHKNYRADFDLDKCEQCSFKNQCPTKGERKYRKKVAIFRFKPQDVLRQKRHKAIQKIPKERQTLRSGVENLMGRLRRGEKHTGKLKITGQFNFELYIFSMGVVINFERIFRYLSTQNDFFKAFLRQVALWITLCQRTFDFRILKLSFSKYVFHI